MSRVKLFRNASLAALGLMLAVPATLLAQDTPPASAPAEAAKEAGDTKDSRAERRAQHLLERFDANKDGSLDATELAAIGENRGGEGRGFRRGGDRRHGEMRGHGRYGHAGPARWQRGDHGPRHARWRPGPEMQGKMIDRLFERADADKDGTVTRAEIDAYKTTIAERHAERAERRGRGPAVKLEGGVTLEELAAAIEKLREERAAQ